MFYDQTPYYHGVVHLRAQVRKKFIAILLGLLLAVTPHIAYSQYTQRIGNGPSTASGYTFTLNANGSVVVGNSNAISLGDNAVITLGANSTVSNTATTNNGLWGGGPNTIEFGSNGTLTIAAGASVLALGTQNNGEPINVFGQGNTITNYGTITSNPGAAIWFEDKVVGATNTVDNYGTITTKLGANASVIGNSGAGSVTFINETGATVNGSLTFGSGNDNMTLYAGSVITGSMDGGGGTNTLTLNGVAGSSDTLAGSIRNFQTLTKAGLGTWTLTGAIGANGGNTPLKVDVNQGTLVLTGNNANFNGSITVDPAGTLQARAQSLPPSILDNGMVQFAQDVAGTYAGVISGSGAVDKTLGGDLTLSGTNTYSGGTTIEAGTIFISSDANLGAASGSLTLNGGMLGSVANVTSARAVTIGSLGGGLNTAAGTTLTMTGAINGAGSLTKTGAGTAVLTGTNYYVGGTVINQGVLQISSNGNLGLVTGALTINGGTLQTTANMTLSRYTTIGSNNGTIDTAAGTTLTSQGTITGPGQLIKIGGGTLDLSYTNDMQLGGTAINGGTVKISSDSNLGDPSAAVSFNGGTLLAADSMTITRNAILNAGGGTIEVDGNPYTATDYVTMSGSITGSGGLNKTGTGSLMLTGTNNYTGATNVNNGFLFVDGTTTTSAINVASGARLSGDGTINGNVNLGSGSTFGPASTPNTAATLTINGNLNINNGATLLYNIMNTTVGGALNDLTVVNGNLTLGGQIDIIDEGQTLGPGVYRVINYTGTLTNNGLTIGSTYVDETDASTGRPLTDLSVQTVVPGQVNLINTTGLSLTYWDGSNIANINNNLIDGGNGTWTAGTSTSNWTDPAGAVNAPWSNGQFAIFIGAPGTVTVDNSQGQVSVSGMQFGVDGYVIQGGAIQLVGSAATPGDSTIRVGDGTTASAAMTATINSQLFGNSLLRKTDLGTLVLTAANTYTGGTVIEGGTVQITQNANLGDVAGSLTLNGGTLQAAANMTIPTRAVTLGVNGGTIETADASGAATTLEIDSQIGGTGALTKTGAGTLLLTADSTISGGTTISAGTIQLGNGGTSGMILGPITDNSALVVDRSDTVTLPNVISGTGSLTQAGTGTTILTADNTYTGGTTISAGTLQIGNNGTTGSIVGDVANNGTLVFDRSDTLTMAGVISGTGGVVQQNGITITTGNNTYTGPTDILGGWIYIDGNQSAATGLTTVASGARLDGDGIIGGNVVLNNGATLGPGYVPNTPATLTINGNLTLSPTSELLYNMVQANVAGGALNDLTVVNGNLTLDGVINIVEPPGQTLGPGVYHVIDYSGTLTDNGLTVGNYVIPPNTPQDSEVVVGPLTGFSVQTSITGQVNLVNTAGLTLNYWDASSPNNGTVNGGTGVWQSAGALDHWTDSNATINTAWADGSFAIFTATPGTVTVDNSLGAVTASGMQFDANGYVVQGNDITLIGPQSIIRVGDGTALGSMDIATIAANLIGSTQLVKTDLGTLILTGTNTYTGGTDIQGGALQVDPASTTSLTNLSTGTVNIASGATLFASTNGAFSFDNALTGTGTLSVSSNGQAFSFGAGAGSAFAGTAELFENTFALSGNNAAALTNATLVIGTGNVTTVSSNSTIGGLTFDGGTMIFSNTALNALAPAQTVAPNLLTVTNLDVSGTGAVEINIPNPYALTTPTPAGDSTLFTQSHDTGAQLQLIDATGTVTGDASQIVLEDQNGNAITSAQNVNVVQNGNLVAIGTYDYGLTTIATGASTASGLYVDYLLQSLDLQTGQSLTLDDAGATGSNADLAAQLTGSGNLVIASSDNGIVSLSNPNNTFTGTTTISSGTLQANAVNVIASSSAVTINAGATFDTNGYDQSINNLNGDPGSQVLVSTNTTLTLNGNTPSNTFAGVISGAGSLVQASGTQILTGANTYTGGTTISGGTLQLGNGGTSGSILGDIVDNAALVVDRSDSLLLTGVISGTGSFTQAGTGTTVLEADNTYTGGTTVSAGTLQIGNGSNTGSVVGDIVDNGHLVFNRADTYTLSSQVSGTGALVQAGLGTLVLTNTSNSYTGGTAIESGVLQISSDAALGAPSGPLFMAGGTLQTTADITTARAVILGQGGGGTFDTLTGTTLSLTGTISGAGDLAKTGGGTLLVNTVGDDYTGAMTVYQGTLQTGAANTLSPYATVTVNSGGILNLAGYSQTIAGLTNGGVITMGIGTTPGAVLTVNGNYVGNGGAIVLNTILGSDNSLTDKLVVNGSTSGTTNLYIVNAGGLGAKTTGNGIQIVQVNGASNGQFNLANSVSAGAFRYGLFQNGIGANAADGDWYLRTMGIRPEAPLDAVVPALASRLGFAMLGTLDNRNSGFFDPAGADDGHSSQLWSRMFGQIGEGGSGGSGNNLDFGRNGPAYNFDFGGIQIGDDLIIHSEQDNSGLYFSAATMRSNVKDASNAPAGWSTMDGYGLGLYWTHHDLNGWYTDLVTQMIWYENIRTRSMEGVAFDTSGWGFSASAETGYIFSLANGYSIAPQGQVLYQRTSIDNGADSFGQIHFGDTNEVYGRCGLRFAKGWFNADTNARVVTIWTAANFWHQFANDDAKTTFTTLQGDYPTTISTGLGGTWAQVELGLSARLAQNISAFGSFDYNVEMEQSGQSFGGQAGVQIGW